MKLGRDALSRDFLLAREQAPVVRLGEASRQPLPAGAVAIGVFDGVHKGHRDLLRRTIADARARGVAAYAVTFDPDPDRVVSRTPAPHLLSTDDRLRLLATTGVDGVIVIPFTPALAVLDHARFFEEVLFPVCPVCALHVGSDFRLGAHGASTVPIIKDWCAKRRIPVFGHDLVSDAGVPISASRIRNLIAAGSVDVAAQELERNHMVRGTVQAGRGQGTGMGFPTANISVDPDIAMPGEGVYAGFALVNGTAWPAAINVGLPPTYRDEARAASLEANLIGYQGDLYGSAISLSFVEFLRPSRVFSSTDELIACVLGNIDYIRSSYGEAGVRLNDDF